MMQGICQEYKAGDEPLVFMVILTGDASEIPTVN
jgi:hypothetical protein